MERIPEPEPMDLVAEAKAYAEADFDSVNEVFVDRLMALTAGLDEAVAADFGTGPGDIPVRVARRRPGWHIAALDISWAMLAYARRAAITMGAFGRIQPVLQDAKAVPFKPRAFDVIFSNSILHHITDTARLWESVRDTAKPGAHVLFRDLARPDSSEAAWSIVKRYSGNETALLQEEFHRSLLSAYTPDEVRAQLDAAHLTTIEVAMVSDRHMDIFGQIGD